MTFKSKISNSFYSNFGDLIVKNTDNIDGNSINKMLESGKHNNEETNKKLDMTLSKIHVLEAPKDTTLNNTDGIENLSQQPSISQRDVSNIKNSLAQPTSHIDTTLSNLDDGGFKKRMNILKMVANTLSMFGKRVKTKHKNHENKLDFNTRKIPMPVSMKPNIVIENIRVCNRRSQSFSLKDY